MAWVSPSSAWRVRLRASATTGFTGLMVSLDSPNPRFTVVLLSSLENDASVDRPCDR